MKNVIHIYEFNGDVAFFTIDGFAKSGTPLIFLDEDELIKIIDQYKDRCWTVSYSSHHWRFLNGNRIKL